MSNTKSKDKPRDITLFGTKFLLEKGIRKELNKKYPKLKGEKLTEKNLPRVINF